jgi:hypothetical protein
MKPLFVLLTLACSALATVVPVESGKILFYQITALVNNDTNSEVHCKQNGIYWFVSHYQGQHIAGGTNATERYGWTAATLWDGNPGHEMRELGNLTNDVRLLPIGTDSVALVIVDADSTYLYKRLATTSSAPEVWTRSSRAGTFDSLLYATYSNGTLTHTYPNSLGWTVVAGELVKAESTFTFPGILLYGRVEADFKGNLWTYGVKQGTISDTMLFKYERLTGRGFSYAGRGAARFLNRDLSIDMTRALIGRNGRIDSCYIGTTPYITPRLIDFSAVASQTVNWNSFFPVTIVDDVAPLRTIPIWDYLHQRNYRFSDSVGSVTLSNGTNYAFVGIGKYIDCTRFPEYTSTRYRKYDYQAFGVWNGHPDSAKTMSDTTYANWTVMSDFMKVVSVLDTAIYDTTNYSRLVTVTNSMRLRLHSMKLPSWLSIEDVGEDTSEVNALAPNYQKSLHFFRFSGVPGTGHTTGEVDTIKLVFIDSLQSIRNGELFTYFQTCSLSYRITLTATGTAIQSVTPKVLTNKRVSNVQMFDLLGRPVNSEMKASAIVIHRMIDSRQTKTAAHLPR